ncbi:MAG TPA: HAD-IA family hydrolase [Ktedonosporobacter sp.]|nr:HAD-IA family hydrolase [Ktedonosporobacter sp.]
MLKTLIFDFDGLILDTETSALQSWQEIYSSYQVDFPLEKWMSGLDGSDESFPTYEYLVEQVTQPLLYEEVIAKRRQRHLELIGTKAALPGVLDYLTTAKRLGLRIGLASSSSREWVAGHLSRLGLYAYFDVLCCGDEVVHRKPYPDVYLAVLKALDTPANQAIALEDSATGLRAAQQAGLFCVVIPNALIAHLSLAHADLRLQSLTEMPLEDVIAVFERRQVAAKKDLLDSVR